MKLGGREERTMRQAPEYVPKMIERKRLVVLLSFGLVKG